MAQVKERGTGGEERKETFPLPLFHFLALVSFLARSIPKVPFLGISLLRKQTGTLATQAISIDKKIISSGTQGRIGSTVVKGLIESFIY